MAGIQGIIRSGYKARYISAMDCAAGSATLPQGSLYAVAATGYSLLEVKTLAEAVEWAKRAPLGDGAEAVVELRPLFDPSEFDVPGEAEERAKRLGVKAGKA